MPDVMCAGIDVSAKTLAVATIDSQNNPTKAVSFTNNASGYSKLLRHLRKLGVTWHVCLEPTQSPPGRSPQNHAWAWQLTQAQAQAVVGTELRAELRSVQARVARLRKAALVLIKADKVMAWHYKQLNSIVGVALASGIRLLAELDVLPDDLTKGQWVAAAGLDPVPRECGTSLKGRRRISKKGNKHLRTALNIPALVAAQHCPEVKAYYEKLQARGRCKMSALCAVMRKLLQAIWGMYRSNTLWNPKRFYQNAP